MNSAEALLRECREYIERNCGNVAAAELRARLDAYLAPNPEQPCRTPVTESLVPAPEAGNRGVAPTLAAAGPDSVVKEYLTPESGAAK